MRILVVGAGAIGGYFGGRMLQAGCDVTFLVRPKRAAELAAAGLVIKSPNGDVTLKNPPAVQANQLTEKFDVVLLSCKAFDLEDAIKSFAPAVGSQTSIVPLLNGMLHLDVLDRKFGRERVLGGLCAIAATLNEHREVVQLNPMQSLSFGERDGKLSDRVRAIAGTMASGNFGSSASENIVHEMWEKWNSNMRDWLTASQDKSGHQRGSWMMKGEDHGFVRGGRLYCTSMATMILEVYYRHMPIYGKQAATEDFKL